MTTEKSFKVFDFDALWIQLKIFLRLPFPLRNHFYKWKRIGGLSRYWFCAGCGNIFHLLPWKDWKNTPIDELKCPVCESAEVYWGTGLTKAIIDRRPFVDLQLYPEYSEHIVSMKGWMTFEEFLEKNKGTKNTEPILL